jgi:DUF438 domain-containing protein
LDPDAKGALAFYTDFRRLILEEFYLNQRKTIVNAENTQQVKHIAPAGHPVHTLMEEHHHVLNFAAKLVQNADDLKQVKDFATGAETLKITRHLIEHFKSSQSHYLREENVLFPYLEKHGIAGPPRAMWAEHDQVRALEKVIFTLWDERERIGLPAFAALLREKPQQLQQLLTSHFYKENNILFPMAMQTLTEDEWRAAAVEFDKIGYCCFTPASARKETAKPDAKESTSAGTGMIDLDTGSLKIEELKAMLNNLPAEITFVDRDDTFRYFNKVKDPAFPRSKAAIGLKVQNCHPQKSVHLVSKIIEDFRSGASDEVSFWINFKTKYIYIRYLAVRDSEGKYLGCMEVTQDIKDIQKITGEKRLQ